MTDYKQVNEIRNVRVERSALGSHKKFVSKVLRVTHNDNNHRVF